MGAGELRHPIKVLELTSAQDPNSGAPIETWSVVSSCWGKVEGVSGTAFIAAAAEQRETNIKVTVYQQNINPLGTRLEIDGQQYKIEAVLPQNIPALMTMMVSRLA